MAIVNKIMAPMTVYYHDTTTNNSFMEMHNILKAKGIKNNKFFLIIYDAGLMGVDPRDPNLPRQMKLRIMRECTINFWYFIREVVRVPIEGGEIGSGIRYKLTRGNLAMNYLFVYNINQFVEFPRQHGKTVSAICWYLWVFNFGATNTKMMFAHKKHEDSKRNLKKLKELRENLPNYLREDERVGPDGKVIRVPNAAETLQNPFNGNNITTLPAARTPGGADGAGRGATMAIQYYDEFAFLPYNDIVYAAATPAFSRAAMNARATGAPYGMLITTTPGDLTTREGDYANKFRLRCTEWSETFYDFSYDQLIGMLNANKESNFMYVRYTYQMLGSGPEYFDEMVRLMQDWPKIRREVCLEWAKVSTDNPFDENDLNMIHSLVKQEPLHVMYFGKANQFHLKFWDEIPVGSLYPPIIGVDVASGIHQDSSAITVIDSQTTKVIATFKSNYITTPELADMIYTFVSNYARNAIVNIENNGGFGSSVLQMLIKTSIKHNLYYEIKDRVDQESFDGVTVHKRKKKCRVYGSTSNKGLRDKLIELLHQRVMHHRDKFSTIELYDELCDMVVKKNGKTEHADGKHDDLIFSYLWALYVFYYGEDLVNRFHLMKTEIYTDDHYDETSYRLEEELSEEELVDQDVFRGPEDAVSDMIDEQMKWIKKAGGDKSESEFEVMQEIEDQKSLNEILSTKTGREAYAKKYSVDLANLNKQHATGYRDISKEMNQIIYGTDDDRQNFGDAIAGSLGDMFRNLRD